jgi:hypothetical protein
VADTPIVTLRVPANAWTILEQTLRLDAQSHAFDPELRRQITEALHQVETVAPTKIVVPLTTVSDLSDAVDELFNNDSATLLDQDGRPYSRGQVEHALAAWLGRLSEALLAHLADYALNGFRWTEMELPPCSDRDFEAEARGELADRAYERARERVVA